MDVYTRHSLCVCLLVMTMRPAKMAEPIKMPWRQTQCIRRGEYGQLVRYSYQQYTEKINILHCAQ